VLTVSNVTGSGDFSVQDNCTSVAAAGGTCAIQVTFTPTTTGTRTGAVTITDNSAGSPHTVAVNGMGFVPSLTVAPTSLNFAAQSVGSTSAAQAVVVTDPNPLNVAITHIDVAGDFAETNNCGTGLGGIGGSPTCSIMVTFAPTASGARTGTLTLTDSASDSPQVVQLSGGGTTGFAVAASAPTATVAAGSTAMYSVEATAGVGFSGTVNFTCTGAPAAASCTVTPTSVMLTGGTPANVAVAVSTTATSSALRRQKTIFSAAAGLGKFGLMYGAVMLGLILVPASIGGMRKAAALVLLAGIGLLLTAAMGCGGGSTTRGATGTPSGAYTIVVTATSGSTTQSTSLMLTVK
jgi:hypothetical protein